MIPASPATRIFHYFISGSIFTSGSQSARLYFIGYQHLLFLVFLCLSHITYCRSQSPLFWGLPSLFVARSALVAIHHCVISCLTSIEVHPRYQPAVLVSVCTYGLCRTSMRDINLTGGIPDTEITRGQFCDEWCSGGEGESEGHYETHFRDSATRKS